ncbi:ferredoxin-dependent glutamate synthase [Vibrio ishigakensis]|uniref:Ferredoxin-dependent glutamate synthase n=1 Tax=Vibrio ishigakensis TaxID=1481914 RepID=A0A0B8P570_9VIBR|nr:ferredoxin-dependent glutamate synthase [Vibrio ishigakensis]
MITPSKVAWALALGADFVVSARGHMFALGCIQALKCNKDTCPTGITTQNKSLQKGLNVEDKKQRVANYNKYIHYGVGLIAHSCGVTNARDIKMDHVRVVTENGLSIALDKLYQHHE